MSRHHRNKYADYLVYLVALAAACLVRLAPTFILVGISKIIGPLLYHLGGRHRQRVLDQLRLVFRDEKSEKEIEKLAGEAFVNLCMFVFDTVRMSKITSKSWRKYIAEEDLDNIEKLRGRPAMFVSPHLGGFQQMAQVLNHAGVPTVGVQRPLDNPYVDRLLQNQRNSHGAKSISKFDNFLKMRTLIREGRSIGIMVDQDGGKRGIFVDFLGTPASTWTSVSDIHFMFKVPIVISSAPRIDYGPCMNLRIWDIIDYDPELAKEYKSSKERRNEVTHEIIARVNKGLSEAILEAPEQWLWQHRRWKTRPRDENIPQRDGVPCPWLTDEEIAEVEKMERARAIKKKKRKR